MLFGSDPTNIFASYQICSGGPVFQAVSGWSTRAEQYLSDPSKLRIVQILHGNIELDNALVKWL